MELRPHRPEASVAAGTTERVGAILTRAEQRAEVILRDAERAAEALGRSVRAEAELVASDAVQTAESAARDRVRRVVELRDAIAGRADSLVEGLDGGELTAARLDEVVSALTEAADRLREEAGDVELDADRGERPARPERDAAPFPAGAPMVRRPDRGDGARAAELLEDVFGRADATAQ